MFEELSLVRMASAMARHASARHSVVAENISNADTPGYRAREVKAFAEYVNEPFTTRATRPGHLNVALSRDGGVRMEIFNDPNSEASKNGNSVNLETEMLKAHESRSQHTLATAIYRKTHDLLRLGLGRGG